MTTLPQSWPFSVKGGCGEDQRAAPDMVAADVMQAVTAARYAGTQLNGVQSGRRPPKPRTDTFDAPF